MKKIDPMSLAGKLLLAMPSLGDPRFHRAVIFMCAHDENGAMGIVLNHLLSGLTFSDLMVQVKIGEGSAMNDIPVISGGPVEPARGFLLHSADFTGPDTVRVTDEFHVTGTIDALRAVAAGKGPKDLIFALGYAGWTAGQLEHEIQDNAWLVADPNPALIFNHDPDDMWPRIIKNMGIDPAMLSAAAGRA